MTVSELILALEDIRRTEPDGGSLEVDTYSPSWDRIPLGVPEIAYRKILNRRQSKPAFWSNIIDKEEVKGEKVVRL